MPYHLLTDGRVLCVADTMRETYVTTEQGEWHLMVLSPLERACFLHNATPLTTIDAFERLENIRGRHVRRRRVSPST